MKSAVAGGAVAVAAIALLYLGTRDDASTAVPAARPKCAAASLMTWFGESRTMGFGRSLIQLRIRNRSTVACTIRGGITLELSPGTRGRVVVEQAYGGSFGPPRARLTLPAGATAYAGLILTHDCRNPRLPRRTIDLRIRTGHNRSAAFPIATCPSGASIQIGFWQPPA